MNRKELLEVILVALNTIVMPLLAYFWRRFEILSMRVDTLEAQSKTSDIKVASEFTQFKDKLYYELKLVHKELENIRLTISELKNEKA